MRPAGVLLVLCGLAAAAVCARLGFWQLGRAAEKRALRVEQRTRLSEELIRLGDTLPDPAPTAGRRAYLRGRWDRERHVLLSGRTHLGAAGVVLVTPLVLASGARVLVERGWMEAADSRIAHPELLADSTVEVVGVFGALAPRTRASAWEALPAERAGVELWSARTLDSAQVPARMPSPIATYYVHALSVAGSVTTRGGPVKLAIQEAGAGESVHNAYAVQWFAFALIALAGTVALLVRDARRGRPGAPAGQGSRSA